MICTSVVPCFSSGLAKNNKMMFTSVLLSWLFSPFRLFSFVPKMGGQTLYQSSQTGDFKSIFKDAATNKQCCYF